MGVSSHQFDEADRGFSTRFDADLDMRMNQKTALSAFEVVNTYSEEKLANLLFQYGELRASRGMAKSIIEARVVGEIVTTFQLRDAIVRFLSKRERIQSDGTSFSSY